MVVREAGRSRITAAHGAARANGIALIGRSSAVNINSRQDAIERLFNYAALSYNALMPVGTLPPDWLCALHRATELPFILSELLERLDTRDGLTDLGVRVLVQGHRLLADATEAAYKTQARNALE